VNIHEKYINRCIQIAKNAIPLAYPNPAVGCCIVHKNNIIAEGYTSEYGGSHAEVNAINSLKNKLSNFNKSSFSKSALKTSNSFLNEKDQLILVQEFNDPVAAMDYYDALRVNKGALKGTLNKFECFIISEKNLAALYIGKDLTKYISFFKANYLD